MKKMQGFTLIEIMIVVVIIGILASIAYPNYTEYVRRSNRAEGQAFLNDIAARQERFFAQNNRYVTANDNSGQLGLGTRNSPNDLYTVSLRARAGNVGYVLTATNNFNDTRCGNLTLNDLGERGVTDGTLGVNDCWR